jgi:hypothetical protein
MLTSLNCSILYLLDLNCRICVALTTWIPFLVELMTFGVLLVGGLRDVVRSLWEGLASMVGLVHVVFGVERRGAGVRSRRVRLRGRAALVFQRPARSLEACSGLAPSSFVEVWVGSLVASCEVVQYLLSGGGDRWVWLGSRLRRPPVLSSCSSVDACCVWREPPFSALLPVSPSTVRRVGVR